MGPRYARKEAARAQRFDFGKNPGRHSVGSPNIKKIGDLINEKKVASIHFLLTIRRQKDSGSKRFRSFGFASDAKLICCRNSGT
jgi:hypothetical protein